MSATVLNPNNSGTISMALAGITPLVDYDCQVTNMSLEPTGATTEVPGTYCQAKFDQPDGLSKWALVISFLQDWGASPSLSKFTMDNDGELCDFSFEPDIDGIPTMTGQVYVQATPYGGAAGAAWQGGPFRWPMKGEPTFVAPALIF
jgi:hypothetical protein